MTQTFPVLQHCLVVLHDPPIASHRFRDARHIRLLGNLRHAATEKRDLRAAGGASSPDAVAPAVGVDREALARDP
jgi:hypothetical protein